MSLILVSCSSRSTPRDLIIAPLPRVIWRLPGPGIDEALGSRFCACSVIICKGVGFSNNHHISNDGLVIAVLQPFVMVSSPADLVLSGRTSPYKIRPSRYWQALPGQHLLMAVCARHVVRSSSRLVFFREGTCGTGYSKHSLLTLPPLVRDYLFGFPLIRSCPTYCRTFHYPPPVTRLVAEARPNAV